MCAFVSFVFNILGRKRKGEQTQDETFQLGDNTYRLGHEKKHFKHTSRIRRVVGSFWKNKPATFNAKIRDQYSKYLQKAIRAYKNNKEKTNFICLGEIVGVDEGTDKKAEETSVVELYWDFDNNYHMRPKAESWLSRDEESICHVEGTNCRREH